MSYPKFTCQECGHVSKLNFDPINNRDKWSKYKCIKCNQKNHKTRNIPRYESYVYKDLELAEYQNELIDNYNGPRGIIYINPKRSFNEGNRVLDALGVQVKEVEEI